MNVTESLITSLHTRTKLTLTLTLGTLALSVYMIQRAAQNLEKLTPRPPSPGEQFAIHGLRFTFDTMDFVWPLALGALCALVFVLAASTRSSFEEIGSIEPALVRAAALSDSFGYVYSVAFPWHRIIWFTVCALPVIACAVHLTWLVLYWVKFGAEAGAWQHAALLLKVACSLAGIPLSLLLFRALAICRTTYENALAQRSPSAQPPRETATSSVQAS